MQAKKEPDIVAMHRSPHNKTSTPLCPRKMQIYGHSPVHIPAVPTQHIAKLALNKPPSLATQIGAVLPVPKTVQVEIVVICDLPLGTCP